MITWKTDKLTNKLITVWCVFCPNYTFLIWMAAGCKLLKCSAYYAEFSPSYKTEMQRKCPLSIWDGQWNSDSDSNFPSVKRPETSQCKRSHKHSDDCDWKTATVFVHSQHRCDSALSSPFKQEVPAGPVGPSSFIWLVIFWLDLHCTTLPLVHAPPTLVVLLIVWLC